MRLLTTSSSLERAFEQSLTQHTRVSFAVAWSSHDFPGCDELIRHEDKIDQGVVGIHFYQTHPSFIEHFLHDDRVKFMKNSSGVFHPKIYVFETSPKDWTCLIGSANFTAAAFSTNSEACLLIEAKDDPSGATTRKLDSTLARLLASENL